MKNPFFDIRRLNELNTAVIGLLTTHGVFVRHKPLREIARKHGAAVDEAAETVRYSAAQIEKLAAEHNKNAGAVTAEKLPSAYTPSVNDSIPFVYDFDTGKKRRASAEDAADIIKAQQVCADFTEVHSPVMLGGVHPLIEPLKRYILPYYYTDKKVGAVGFWDDRLIPYLLELDRLYGRTSRGFGSGNFFISPLALDENTGRKILANAKNGVENGGTGTMATGGISAPATVDGVALIGAAEILAGALLTNAVNKHFGVETKIKISGGAATGMLDMQTLQGAFSTPEAILSDLMIHEFFKEIYHAYSGFNPSYTDARLPGMQCMRERVTMYSACAYAGYPSYVANFSCGNLFTCTVHSNAQMMADIELGRCLYHYFANKRQASMEDLLEDVKDVLENGGSFLTSELTAAQYKNNFYSFTSDVGAWRDVFYYDSEREIMEEANLRYKKLLAAYEQPEIDAYRQREAERIINRAEKDLL